jgi:uncharacterized protein YdiU (UPF0061 family)
VLRNWMAQEAIQAAEGGDYLAVGDLLDALRFPFMDEQQAAEALAAERAAGGEQEVARVCRLRERYAGQVPAWAAGLCVTCSS